MPPKFSALYLVCRSQPTMMLRRFRVVWREKGLYASWPALVFAH